MGIYINPGNASFRVMRNHKYVDKSGLIGVINKTIGKRNKLSCISRPRRFGKSYAAQMLCAYYCVDCDSSPLFDDLEIAQDETYRAHLNQYNVLYLDISGFIGEAGARGMLDAIIENVSSEILLVGISYDKDDPEKKHTCQIEIWGDIED